MKTLTQEKKKPLIPVRRNQASNGKSTTFQPARKSGCGKCAPGRCNCAKCRAKHRNQSSSAATLPAPVRRKMERTFGQDFSGVRITTNSPTAARMGAAAYTIGEEVHFSRGAYAPSTPIGQELIAHELTHVVQQRRGVAGVQLKKFGSSGSSLEVEADNAAAAYASGSRFEVRGRAGAQPQMGWLSCMYYTWKFGDLLEECENEYREVCGQDLVSRECLTWMDGAGYPSHGILRCVGRKDPEAMADLMSSCAGASVGGVLRR